MSARSSLLFSAEVLPRELQSESSLARLAASRKADVVATAVSDKPTVRGWILPPEGTAIRGLRAINTRQIAVAKRKQTRLDIYVLHQQHPDALQCGFIIEPDLQPGWNEFELQYKDQHRHWHPFCKIHIKLPRLRHIRRPKCIAIPTDHEDWSRQHNDATPAELRAMADYLSRLPGKPPLLSVLMPTFNTPKRWLKRAIESIQQQIYPHWELCIADDFSDDPATRRLLRHFAARDSRIKVKFLQQRGHICHTSNAALELCQGDFTVLLDHDDELPPQALFHFASEAVHHPATDIMFSDEDKVDLHGFRSDPYFKPGWNYDLLLSENCVSHAGAFRTSLLREIGGFRPGYEGSQDWDLTLRAFERSTHEKVRHIPRILYHWRTLANSTASGLHAKPYARQAGQRAVLDHLQRTCPRAQLEPLNEYQWRVLWPMPEPRPLVSLIVGIDHLTPSIVTSLEQCLADTSYGPLELILLTPADAQDFALLTRQFTNVRLVPASGSENIISHINRGASEASGEVLIFQQRPLQILHSDWLNELVRQTHRPTVGVVAASVISPSELIHHGGISLHPGHLIQAAHRDLPINLRTVGGPSDAVREVSAVADACFALRRQTWLDAGGFDTTFASSLAATIDFCLKTSAAGLHHLVTPFSKLRLREGLQHNADRTSSIPKKDAQQLAARWPTRFTHDPFFNANLAAVSTIPIASSPSAKWPWKS